MAECTPSEQIGISTSCPGSSGEIWTPMGAMLSEDFSPMGLLTFTLVIHSKMLDANRDLEMASAQSLAQTWLLRSSLYCIYEYL